MLLYQLSSIIILVIILVFEIYRIFTQCAGEMEIIFWIMVLYLIFVVVLIFYILPVISPIIIKVFMSEV